MTPPPSPSPVPSPGGGSGQQVAPVSAVGAEHAPPAGQTVGDRPARRRVLPQRLLEGRGWNAVLAGVDAGLLLLGVAAAWLGAPAAGLNTTGAFEAWLLPPLAIGLLALRGAYRARLGFGVLDWIVQAVGATSLSAMSLLAVDSLASSGGGASALLIRVWLFATLYVAGGRIVLGLVRRGAQANRVVGRRTLIVGAGRVGAQMERRLRTHPELGLEPVGYLDADPIPDELAPGRRLPVLGAPADVLRVAEQTRANHIIFAFQGEPDRVLVPLVAECMDRGLETSVVPRLFDSVNSRMELEHLGGLPLYGLRGVNPRGWQFTLKHVLGKGFAGTLLVLLSPVMLAVAAAVKLASPGPVIFRQRRVGRDGREFDLLKFRSMRSARPQEAPAGVDEEPAPLRLVGDDDLGPGGLETRDLRLTPIGRFLRRSGLDELPQLWNVVRGDMALVGPRPERPELAELFAQSVRRYDDRHRVKAGITGWAQVHGLRGRTSLADRIEWDNFYIENWSLWLDFKILVMTLAAPLRFGE